MSQQVLYWHDGKEYCRTLPDARDTVMPGVLWGEFTHLFTPAYWVSQFWMNGYDNDDSGKECNKYGNLVDETVFCLLGGHGISAELAYSVFWGCKESGLVDNMEDSEEVWLWHLSQKYMVNGRLVSYRFPKQKAKYISGAMPKLKEIPPELKGKRLRDNLLQINGIGPKTAGWIVRNCYGSDDVAIIDIHIQRAGQLCGFFDPLWTPEKHYSKMEEAFLLFCANIYVKPSLFDYLIWDQMRKLGALALDAVRRTVSIPGKFYRAQPI